MFPPFNPTIAHCFCLKLKDALDCGVFCLEQVTRVSEERRNQGVMIGCLVCVDDAGRRVVLVTNSGISKRIVRKGTGVAFRNKNAFCEKTCIFPDEEADFGNEVSSSPENVVLDDFIIVPPIVSAEEIDRALRKNDFEIHELTDKINSLDEKFDRKFYEKFDEKKEEALGSGSVFSGDSLEKINLEELTLEELKSRRATLTTESLRAVHSLYKFACIDGSFFSLPENPLVPTGTGDCCEPKLLHYAFTHGLKPVSMDQIYMDQIYMDQIYLKNASNSTHIGSVSGDYDCTENAPSNSGDFPSVPPCDERCGILLPKMLGLEILYVDEHIVVVNKQSGLLSVPGRGEEKQDCVVNRVKSLYPHLCKIAQPSVHRLDMETSGVVVLAFTEDAHRNLSRQFENREVEKEYVALLAGVLEKDATGNLAPKRGEKSGVMKLKFRLDVGNRPHQIYDEIHGKEGITEWENLGLVWYTTPSGEKIKATKIRFCPHTGRTHQLRLAASDSHGFGLPIIGDMLYGVCREGERLMLHAEKLVFAHPISEKIMEFEKKVDW